MLLKLIGSFSLSIISSMPSYTDCCCDRLSAAGHVAHTIIMFQRLQFARSSNGTNFDQNSTKNGLFGVDALTPVASGRSCAIGGPLANCVMGVV